MHSNIDIRNDPSFGHEIKDFVCNNTMCWFTCQETWTVSISRSLFLSFLLSHFLSLPLSLTLQVIHLAYIQSYIQS